MFEKMMRNQNVSSLSELLETAVELDVELLGCLMSMDVMEITEDNPIDEVDDVAGAATMLAHAKESQVHYLM